jgi:tetratricopeptide (TPR) repeat protein
VADERAALPPPPAPDDAIEARVAAWLRGVTERELDERDLPAPLPAWAEPVRLRLAGELDEARAALPRAIMNARTDGQRTVVALEAAAAGQLDVARGLAPDDPLLALTLARLADDADAERAAIARVPPAILAARGEIPTEIAPLAARWQALAAQIAAPVVRCGPPPPGPIPTSLQDAKDYVDRAPAAACRGHEVARAFAAAGDVAGAVVFADLLLAEDPADGEAARDAAVALAGAGQGPRAWLYLPRAELAATATTRGAASVAVARAFLRAGDAIEAIRAGRQALAVARSGEQRDAAFAVIIDASAQAGRTADAAAAQMAWDKERPPPTVKIVDLGAAGGVPDRTLPPDQLQAELKFLGGLSGTARARAALDESAR